MIGAFQTALAVLVALGGGGAIVAGLSGWLGKVWANRLMAKDRANHEESLERLRDDLEATRVKMLSAHQDKVALYRHVIDILAPMITKIDLLIRAQQAAPDEVQKHFIAFEHDRLRAYGYVAMFAPQFVMDRFDALIDYLLDVSDEKIPFEFSRIRELGIALVNEIRKDLKIDVSPIEYRGHRK